MPRFQGTSAEVRTAVRLWVAGSGRAQAGTIVDALGGRRATLEALGHTDPKSTAYRSAARMLQRLTTGAAEWRNLGPVSRERLLTAARARGVTVDPQTLSLVKRAPRLSPGAPVRVEVAGLIQISSDVRWRRQGLDEDDDLDLLAVLDDPLAAWHDAMEAIAGADVLTSGEQVTVWLPDEA